MENYLPQNHIFLNADVSTQEEALTYIAQKAETEGVCHSASALKDAFCDREKQGPTGLQDGFAIPHATATCIKKPAIYLLKPAHPLPWKTLDQKDVSVVIALLLPTDSPTKHLTLLSRITALLMQPDFCAALKEATDANEISRMIDSGLA